MTEPITDADSYAAMAALSALPYFPSDPIAQTEIANQIRLMCKTDDQAQWLVQRTFELWSKWEGPRELRAIFCARFKPQDGVEVMRSAVFEDGIVPAEKPLPVWHMPVVPGAEKLLPQTRPQLIEQSNTAALVPTSDFDQLPELSRKQWKQQNQFAKQLEAVITAPEDRPKLSSPKSIRQSDYVRLNEDPIHEARPEGSYQRITQADIEVAVAELHRKKAQDADAPARKDDDN